MANYYQAGDNYGRGGHYQYQAGGLPILGGLLRAGASLLPKIVRGAGSLLGIGKKASTAIVPVATAGSKVIKVLKDVGIGVGAGAIGASFLNGGGFMGGRRSMNHLNPKAAMRAVRRIDGFKKKARKILGAVGYTVGPRGGGRGSKGCGHRGKCGCK